MMILITRNTWVKLTVTVTIAVILTAVLVHRRRRVNTPRPKSLSFRIDDIPTDHTDQLVENLRSLAEQDPDLRRALSTKFRHTLTPKDKRFICATVSITTTLSGEEVCARLHRSGDLQGYKYSYTCVFDGITPLYEHEDGADVDIIAVPGLGSHAFGSWKAQNSDEIWLRDFLPEDIPNIRVLLYGYDTKLPGSQSKQSIEDLGRAFLEQITAFRTNDGTSRRPIILIGHSLGGLLIKEALIRARQPGSNRPPAQSEFARSCFGLLFFGVPNLGLRNEQLQTLVQGQPNQSLIDNLLVDNDSEPKAFLKRLAEQFSETCKGYYRVVTFFERTLSPTLERSRDGGWSKTGRPTLLVTEKSATSTGLVAVADEDNVSLNTDHSGLVKYKFRNQGDYTIVRERIRKLVDEASLEVAKRVAEQGFDLPCSVSTEQCLKSLAFEDMDSRQDRIEEAFAGTCEWLLGHDTLAQWCRQHRGLLWLKGNPGSGKSTIMQFALQEVPAIYDEKTIMISFFFHARGNELQKNPLGLYRSLLHQLLKCVPGALSDMVTYFEERRRTIGNEWKWEIRILQSFLESSLPRILERFPVILCIDALDECAENSAVKLIAYFKRLLSMLPSTNSRFGILLSCRHHPILELREGLTIRLEKENNADIANFVQAQLATSDVDPETQITICDRAQGVFIWAHMVVNRVLKLKRQGEPRNRIHAEIQKVPPDVDQLYQELIQDVEDRAAALKLMQWICFSTRPLTTDELRWAMAIDPDCTHKTLEACDHLSDLMTKDILETRACVHTDNDHTKKNYSSDCSSNNDFTNSIADPDIERRIKTLSCGLVEIVKSENRCIIQVIHQSVNDFFIDRGLRLLGQTNKSDSVGPAAHFILARSCTLYLRMFMASHPGRDYYLDRDAFPFLLYAATSGFSHVELSEPSEASLGILLEGFSHATGKFDESWPRLCRQLNSAGNWPGPGSNLVHVASMHGFVKLTSCLLRTTVGNIDSKDETGTTPLSLAVRKHPSIVEMLLETGKVDIDSRDNYGNTPLSHACWAGKDSVVKRLLKTGKVDIGSRNYYGNTPLSRACSAGKDSAVMMLLETGKVDIDSRDNNGNTPLSHACWAGKDSVVMMLLETGKVDIDSRDNNGNTPLSRACWAGKDSVVMMLLETGKVDIDSRNNYGDTPLSQACWAGKDSVVMMLLETGKVDIDSRDNDGETPLSRACWAGKDSVVMMLLETGKVDIDSRDNYGNTPLSHTCSAGKFSVVMMLLKTGKVDIDSRNNNGNTPLSRACWAGKDSVVMMLLETGKVDIDSRNNDGETPLSQACYAGKGSVVMMLLETGKVNVNSKCTKNGRTPLTWAVVGGRGAERQAVVVRILLSTATVDINLVDNIQGWTPLRWAGWLRKQAMVDMLRDAGGVDDDPSEPKFDCTA